MAITSINPATGETLKTYDETTPEQAAAAVAQAHETWRAWRTTPFAERAKPMKKTAEILRQRKEELAKLMAVEMGKPLKQGAAEVEKCAWACDYYADNAEAHLAPEIVKTEAREILCRVRAARRRARDHAVEFSVLAGFRFAAPALMAGNVGRAEARIERPGLRAHHRRDLPRGRLSRGHLPHAAHRQRAVQEVIEHPLVRAVTLTGSTPAGKAVARRRARC